MANGRQEQTAKRRKLLRRVSPTIGKAISLKNISTIHGVKKLYTEGQKEDDVEARKGRADIRISGQICVGGWLG